MEGRIRGRMGRKEGGRKEAISNNRFEILDDTNITEGVKGSSRGL